MSKILIAVFAILAVVATNANLTVEELEKEAEYFEDSYISNTERYIRNKYNRMKEEVNRLANDLEKQRVKAFSNSINGILESIEQARLWVEIDGGGVKFMDNEPCSVQSTMQFAEKMPEASTNLTKCFFAKREDEDPLNFITETKRVSLEKLNGLREKLKACINNNKSNADDAKKCFEHVRLATIPPRQSMDEALKNHTGVEKAMFDAAEKSFNLCNEQYGAPNYVKIWKPIYAKIIECINSAGRGIFLRQAPPV